MASYNGKIYAVGGHDGIHALCSVEIYDPVENRWSFGKPLTIARANVSVAIVGKRLYAVGGFSGKTFLNTIEYFDFETEEWSTSVTINKSDKSSAIINGTTDVNANLNGVKHLEVANENGYASLYKNVNSLNGKVPLKNSLSNEPLVEVEETIVGH